MAGKKRTADVFVAHTKPVFAQVVKTNKNFRANFQGALMYAHYELTTADLKKEVIKYLKTLDAKNPLLDRIKDIHENRFGTVGKYMYILNHAGDIPDEYMISLMPFLMKVIDEEEAKVAEAKKEAEYLEKEKGANKQDLPPSKALVTVTIQDRLREKAREVAGEVEGWLDDFHLNRKMAVKTVEDFVNLFKTFELKAVHMRHIQPSFERRGNEIIEAIEGKDKDLNEGYCHYSKPELKKLSQFYQNLLGACNMMQQVAKVTRAPRKPKPVSQEKIVSKLKYKKEDNSLGIVSQNPVHILGAKEVWVYNTKTRKLAQYKAFDERGLLVKGASLENFSSDSLEKTVRKPAETLTEFKKASKVKLRTFLKELSTVDVPAGGKLNEHHVILRIDK